MRLFHSNLVDLDATTITAGSETTGYGVANVAHPFLAKIYKTGNSAGVLDEWIAFDFGAAVNVSALILAGHDLVDEDVLTLELANAVDFSDSVTIEVERIEGFILAVFDTVEVRYARVNITKPADDETRQIGRIYFGEHYEFEDDPDYNGYGEDVVDLSKSTRAVSGQRYTEQRPLYRILKVPLSGIDGDMSNTLQEIVRDLGTHTPCFVQVQDSLGDLNGDPLDEVVYCFLSQIADRTVEACDENLNWKMRLDLEEIPA